MTERHRYEIEDLERFVRACIDAGLVGEPLANAIGVSKSAVSRGRGEGMDKRRAWREAVVSWVDRLYAALESTEDPIYEFKVGDELRFVPLPARLSAEEEVAQREAAARAAAAREAASRSGVDTPHGTTVAAPSGAAGGDTGVDGDSTVVKDAPDKDVQVVGEVTPDAPVVGEDGDANEETDGSAQPTGAQPVEEGHTDDVQVLGDVSDATEGGAVGPGAGQQEDVESGGDDSYDEEEEEEVERLAEVLSADYDPESPWGDPARFDEAYVSARLKEEFEAEFGNVEKTGDIGADGLAPDWRVDGIPVQPSAEVVARYGLEKGRKVWMYRQVCWTAGLVKSHLGLGYSNEANRLLHRLELVLALELMEEYRMTMDREAELEWTAERRVEMVELQRAVIRRYDEITVDLAPRGVLGFGIKCFVWLDSVLSRRKRRRIAEEWGLYW